MDFEKVSHFYKIFSAFPRIELKRVRLREFRDSDAKGYYDYINNPEVSKFVPDDCIPRSVESTVRDLQYYKESMQRYEGISWAIAHKKTDEIIGSASLSMMKFLQRKSNIAYDLAFEYWGKGIAKEAVSAIINFADNELKLDRIQANIAVHNERSRNFSKFFGFEHEGTMRKFEILEGKMCDFDIFARIRK